MNKINIVLKKISIFTLVPLYFSENAMYAGAASLVGKHLDRLQVLQNRAARAVYGCSPRRAPLPETC